MKISAHTPCCRDTLKRSKQSPAFSKGPNNRQGKDDNLSKKEAAEESLSTLEDTADTMISTEIVPNYRVSKKNGVPPFY